MLTNNQLNGLDTVRTRHPDSDVFEDYGYIRKIHQGDRCGVFADVEFADDPGNRCERWVFAKYQQTENSTAKTTHPIAEVIEEMIQKGFSDSYITLKLGNIGTDAHLKLGYLPDMKDLIAVIRLLTGEGKPDTDKNVTDVIDYCQNEDEWESFVEYIQENGAKTIDADELDTFRGMNIEKITGLLEREALGNPECKHIWAVAERARAAL